MSASPDEEVRTSLAMADAVYATLCAFCKDMCVAVLKRARSMDASDQMKLEEKHTARAYEFWTSIVRGYSRCNLPKGSDKLIAVSGVAKKLQPPLDDNFVTGLWRKQLAHGLAWGRADDSNSAVSTFGLRRAAYRALSWPWASLDGETVHPVHDN